MVEQQIKTVAAFAIGNVAGKHPNMEFADINSAAAASLKLTMPWLSDETIKTAIISVFKDIQAVPTPKMH